MANDVHVALLNQGVDAWNAWREENPDIRPDLSGANLNGANLGVSNLLEPESLFGSHLRGANLIKADLSGADLSGANLSRARLNGAQLNGADLSGANLSGADLSGGGTYLIGANLSKANLSKAHLSGAYLLNADLNKADLSKAHLTGVNFRRANLSGANLAEAILTTAVLVDVDLTGADLTGCYIYGVSAWGLKLERAKQQNLIITKVDYDLFAGETPENKPPITVDNLEVAQFISLLLNNRKIRQVIDTITSKTVLILGRFIAERKAVLEALREELRKRDYLPILFDFDKPASRDITETISLLARMARFVVADITDAKAIPQELNVIVPDLPSVPVQPLLLKESSEYGMFEHYARYPWVLPLYRYETRDQLIAALGEQVIEPAERMALQMRSGARPIPTLGWKPAD